MHVAHLADDPATGLMTDLASHGRAIDQPSFPPEEEQWRLFDALAAELDHRAGKRAWAKPQGPPGTQQAGAL